MELIFHKDWRGNFGDDLNIPFFEAIFPNYRETLPNQSLYGIGTLLNNNNNESISNSAIFGSGFGYASQVNWDQKSVKVFGVRGPLTARALGLNVEKYVIGDPAIYALTLPYFQGGQSLTSKKRIVCLHHRTCELWNYSTTDDSDVYFLDPGISTLDSYIATIRQAEIVYAESLHGAIVATTLGIPWIPVWIRQPLEATKWADFMALMEWDHFSPISLPSMRASLIRRVAVSAKTRRLLRPNVLGSPISNEHLSEVSKSINSIHLGSAYRANMRLIEILQSKTHDAAHKLRQFSGQP